MHELCAVEIGLIGRLRDPQQRHQQDDGDQHRVRQRKQLQPRIDEMPGLIGDQRQREAEQRRGGEIDPYLAQIGIHCPFSDRLASGAFRRPLSRSNPSMTSALTAMVTTVETSRDTLIAAH